MYNYINSKNRKSQTYVDYFGIIIIPLERSTPLLPFPTIFHALERIIIHSLTSFNKFTIFTNVNVPVNQQNYDNTKTLFPTSKNDFKVNDQVTAYDAMVWFAKKP